MDATNLISFAKDNAFTVTPTTTSYFFQLNKLGSLLVEFEVPFSEPTLSKGENLFWVVVFKDPTSKAELHREWAELYYDEPDKWGEMLSSLRSFIALLSNHQFRIVEKSLFSLFGRPFGKYKVVEFNAGEEWQEWAP